MKLGKLAMLGPILIGACSSVSVDDRRTSDCPTDDDCLCNCPEGVPERGDNTNFCNKTGVGDGELCCYWPPGQTHVLMVGTCAAGICIAPIEGK